MINHVTSDEVKNNIDNYILLDIREDYERTKDGFIPKSKHIKGSELDIYTLMGIQFHIKKLSISETLLLG